MADVDADAQLAAQLAAQFEADDAEAAARGTGEASVDAGGSGGGGRGGGGGATRSLQVHVVGAEGGGVGGSQPVVYRLVAVGLAGRGPSCFADAPATSLQRFSSFVELISSLAKEQRGGSERSSAAVATLDHWRRQLILEKRHTGKASRSDSVVQARCQMLQRMMDDLLAVPELASSTAVAMFLNGAGTA